MSASISILIITYNRPAETLALLENLKAQQALNQHVKEILLLDNASTVSYQPVNDFLLQNRELPINFIRHTQNLGVAGGRNYLIPLAQAPYLLVLDDDVEFAETDAIIKVAGLFDRKEFIENNTAVITLDIFYYDTGERQRSAFPHKKPHLLEGRPWFLTYYFTGAAHYMRKELFDHTGLYPEDFFYGMEEYDLSYRIINAGYTLAYDNTVKILHKESPTGRMPNREKLTMMWRNKSKVSWRYLPKQYFMSTAFMWSLEYLKKTGYDFSGFFATWKKVLAIRHTERRQAISAKALQYLNRVHARLWY